MNNDLKIRCFVSLDLPTHIIQSTTNIQNNIKNQNFFSGKYTKPQNIHLTLKFLGEISLSQVESVKQALSMIQINPIKIQISNLGVFSRRNVRIIWLKVDGVNSLQKQVDCALSELFPVEERFMGHITIARVKKIFAKNELLNYLDNYTLQPHDLSLTEFKLKQSILSPNGPTYKTIETFKKS